jgi:hypothetical protein
LNERIQTSRTCGVRGIDCKLRFQLHVVNEPPKLVVNGFRTLKVSLSGICDLVAAYKNEPLPRRRRLSQGVMWAESTHNVPAAISKCEVTAAAALAETSPIELDDIAYLVDEQRVVRQPERLATVWLQAECRPIRRIVVWEKPVSAAIERIDQCVASAGVVRNVGLITAAT